MPNRLIRAFQRIPFISLRYWLLEKLLAGDIGEFESPEDINYKYLLEVTLLKELLYTVQEVKQSSASENNIGSLLSQYILVCKEALKSIWNQSTKQAVFESRKS